ncbi:MAG: antibiotic biosynthesis monooxygenase [Rhodoplanes sp.]|uniref:putative quinol monooxygenase n=1 Tax=Rhodoplanes sp. TaxID=1968906 RepID=UPI0017AEB848|nr:putative quinol monooxygenase [Rhodoplanes sp.]NVO17495.1 antibiotic biosynthesis monooxygenase [Rhodoplanes sp.]
MYVVLVDFTIRPAHLAAFTPLMIENARMSLESEPGCRQFDVCRDPAHPELISLYEVYDSPAAFQQHLDSRHFRAFDHAVRDMIAAKQVRTLERLDE